MNVNFVYYLLPHLAKAVVGMIVVVPLMTYYLNPGDYGVAAILTVIIMVMQALANTGAPFVFYAHYFRIDQLERKILLFNVVISEVLLKSIWAIIFFILAPILLPLVVREYTSEYQLYFQIALLTSVFSGLWPTISTVIMLEKKGKIYAIIELVQQLITVIAAFVFLVVFQLRTVVLFLVPLVVSLFAGMISLWYIRHDLRLCFRFSWIQEIVRRGMLPSIPLAFSDIIAGGFDRYFIQRWRSLFDLGIYTHSRSYQGMFNTGTKSFNRVFIPEILQMFAGQQTPTNIKRMLLIWYTLLGIGGVFLSLFSFEVVNLLTHGKFVAAAPLIPIWFLLPFIYSFGIVYTQYLQFHKKTLFLAHTGLIISALFVGVTALLVYFFNIYGAAIAVVLYSFIIQLAQRWYARKLGCQAMMEREWCKLIGIVVATFTINSIFTLNIVERIIIFLVIIALLYAYSYRWIKSSK